MKLFFSGIGGSGMSAIACFMLEAGQRVTGSDRRFDANPQDHLKLRLQAAGAVIVPQDGRAMDKSFTAVVFSTAVEDGSPERAAALKAGVPIRSRPEFLASIASEHETIAVAGTSGKSTTAAMAAFAMRALGMGPSYIGGGRLAEDAVGCLGNAMFGDGPLVIEADESDGSIVNYHPETAVLLNLDLDHHPVDKTSGMFRTFISNTGGDVIVNSDDENLKAIRPEVAVTFSMEGGANYTAAGLELMPLGSAFTVMGERFKLAVPGAHNAQNALAVIAALHRRGVPLRDISGALAEFKGIRRRFQVHLNEPGGKLVVDDYAHNPHKIAALMKSMRAMAGRVCYIFQPHGYGPTRLMLDGYIETFNSYLRDSDVLMLLPIYYAGGTADMSISSAAITGRIEGSASLVTRAELKAIAPAWDAYVVFGARDDSLGTLAEDIAMRFREKERT